MFYVYFAFVLGSLRSSRSVEDSAMYLCDTEIEGSVCEGKGMAIYVTSDIPPTRPSTFYAISHTVWSFYEGTLQKYLGIDSTSNYYISPKYSGVFYPRKTGYHAFTLHVRHTISSKTCYFSLSEVACVIDIDLGYSGTGADYGLSARPVTTSSCSDSSKTNVYICQRSFYLEKSQKYPLFAGLRYNWTIPMSTSPRMYLYFVDSTSSSASSNYVTEKYANTGLSGYTSYTSSSASSAVSSSTSSSASSSTSSSTSPSASSSASYNSSANSTDEDSDNAVSVKVKSTSIVVVTGACAGALVLVTIVAIALWAILWKTGDDPTTTEISSRSFLSGSRTSSVFGSFGFFGSRASSRASTRPASRYGGISVSRSSSKHVSRSVSRSDDKHGGHSSSKQGSNSSSKKEGNSSSKKEGNSSSKKEGNSSSKREGSSSSKKEGNSSSKNGSRSVSRSGTRSGKS